MLVGAVTRARAEVDDSRAMHRRPGVDRTPSWSLTDRSEVGAPRTRCSER